MKDKRIIAMFITSAVALIASVVVTLGVALTLADPVPVSFAKICDFQIGAVEQTSESVTKNGSKYIYENAFEYTPSGSIAVLDWDVESETCDAPVYPIKNQEFGVELQIDDKNEGKISIAYVKIENTTGSPIIVTVGTDMTGSAILKEYTNVMIFDYSTHLYNREFSQFIIQADEKIELAVIVYTDITDMHEGTLVFGEETLNVDLVVNHL